MVRVSKSKMAAFYDNYDMLIAGLRWYGLPITDGAAPDDRFLKPWTRLGPLFLWALQDGERVVVQCKDGLGRAGTSAIYINGYNTLRAAPSHRSGHGVFAIDVQDGPSTTAHTTKPCHRVAASALRPAALRVQLHPYHR